ncbi:hypothetical protein RKE25_12615 [Dyella sp. BiH032]|uniref:hypothetical protein n=1 Tax=Dyella sp. BiH032 TaxID=3075430 RepID=UPI0028930CB1|nr:hypothetical protein [Dyella sp. BiH032]WNL44271.1 hypothetical protein RKE25_12615 [Dyella sp. BiH032]
MRARTPFAGLIHGPLGSHAGQPASGAHPPLAATIAVLELARKIEPDIVAAIHWYRHVPIAELGCQTALRLVTQGRADAVMAFLRTIRDGSRG